MDRFQATKRISLIGILGNLFLLCIKSLVGFMSHSQAMLADAANSATDIFASFMTFIGNKIASEPSDETHNFGHGKAEYVFSLLISISMILLSFRLLCDSLFSFINQHHLVFSWFLVFVCILTIIIKFFLYLYAKRAYYQHQDLLLKANMSDHRNDCVLTLFTLLSILLSTYQIYWMDSVVGMIISIWIFSTGFKILIESYNVLMDKSLDIKTKDLILDLIDTYSEIENVDDIYSSPIGYQYIITITIYVDGNMSTFDSHHIADSLEKNIEGLDKIAKAIIHVNPI